MPSDILPAEPSGSPEASPHLEAARMNNLIADTAFHEFLLEVLCLLILIHLSTEGTRDRVRQSGLQEDKETKKRADSGAYQFSFPLTQDG